MAGLNNTARKARAEERRRTVYLMLKDAADNDRVCPTNQVLATAVGYAHARAINKVLSHLADVGAISISSKGSERVVTIALTNKSTAEPVAVTAPLTPSKPKRPVREIIAMAADIFGFRPSDIYGPARPESLTLARFAVYSVANAQGWSLSHIGRVLARDHSTIMHGRDRAEELVRRRAAFSWRLLELERRAAPAIQTERLAA